MKTGGQFDAEKGGQFERNIQTIDDLRKFKEYQDLSDKEASIMVESIKEFCRIVVDSVISTNNYIDNEPE